MCGRFAVVLPADSIVALLRALGPAPNWPPSWNVAPTQNAPVVRLHPQTRERRLDLLRWGLVPHWAKDPKAVRMTTNARGETLSTTAMFRDAFARRRCLIPADAFYEWETIGTVKQPWAIARADEQPLVFGGVWEGWRGGDGTVIRSFTIVTTAANPALRPLHERMPLVLEPQDWPAWLGETEADIGGLVVPSAAAFRRWKVSPAVNAVRNNDASLLLPLPPESAAPQSLLIQ